MPAELVYAAGTVVLMLVALWIPGGRVLVPPLFFVFLLLLIYWLARPPREE